MFIPLLRRLSRLKEIQITLEEMKAPSLERVQHSSEPKRALMLQLGSGRRAATLRTRVREWKRFRGWLRERFGANSFGNIVLILDYLADRVEEPSTKSVLIGVRAGMRFMSKAVGIGEGH